MNCYYTRYSLSYLERFKLHLFDQTYFLLAWMGQWSLGESRLQVLSERELYLFTGCWGWRYISFAFDNELGTQEDMKNLYSIHNHRDASLVPICRGYWSLKLEEVEIVPMVGEWSVFSWSKLKYGNAYYPSWTQKQERVRTLEILLPPSPFPGV